MTETIKHKKIKPESNRMLFLRYGLMTVFLPLLIVLFLSPAAFAAETANTDAGVRDAQAKRKMMIIYSDDAVYAGDDQPAGEKNAPPLPDQNFNDADHHKASVNINADSIDYDQVREVYHAKGKVIIIYSGAALSADEVELDSKNNIATAQGGAFLKMGEDTLQSQKIVLNIENKTGAAYQASAFYARNNFYVKGDRIEKTGENTYFIKQPVATTCDGDHPDWRIAGSEMKVTLEGYGVMKDARFLAKGLPILYAPILPFPVKTKRQSGFLLPYLAYSRDKDGVDIELPFFWAISDEMDATFYQRYMEKRGFKEGAEFRYNLGAKSFGTFYGDYIEDTRHVTETDDASTSRDWQEMHKRWSYFLSHQTNFDSQFYLRTDLMKVSDKWYFKDFSGQNYYLDHYTQAGEDNFKNVSFKGDQSLRYTESTVRVYKGWSNYNLTGSMNAMEDFAAVNNDHILQKYPEIVLTGIKQPFLKTPLYYELTGTYDYLYRGEGDKGHFVDFSPALSLPFNVGGYLQVTPQFALKETFWSRDDSQTDSKNKTADRTVFNASVSVSSRLSRIFNVDMKNWEKIRHEIKPEVVYSYIPDVNADNVPDYYQHAASSFSMPLSFLSSDALTEQNAVAWSLTNTLTAKVRDEAGASSYLEFLRLKVFQTYDIHEANKDMAGSTVERRPLSDMGIELDLAPHKYFSFKARGIYNVYDGWKQNNYDLYLKDERGDFLQVGYRNTQDSVEEINVSVKAVITDRIDGTIVSRHDILNSKTIENSIGLFYHKQCWGMGFDLTETNDDVRFMFKISLTGLGTGFK